jgi:HAD superfamily hydrolase (TIGR01509 family)
MQETHAVVFDFDGTLFTRDQSTQYLANATARLNVATGISISTDELAEQIYREANIPETLRHRISLDENVPKEIYSRMQTVADRLFPPNGLGINLYAREIDPARWYPDSELIPTLEALRSNNIKIGLLSNCGWDVTTVLEHCGLMEYFDACALSYKIGHRKPEAQAFQIICNMLDVPHENAIMVGDKPPREQPATEIGMHHLNVDLLLGGSVGISAVLPFAAALGHNTTGLGGLH